MTIAVTSTTLLSSRAVAKAVLTLELAVFPNKVTGPYAFSNSHLLRARSTKANSPAG